MSPVAAGTMRPSWNDNSNFWNQTNGTDLWGSIAVVDNSVLLLFFWRHIYAAMTWVIISLDIALWSYSL